MRVMHTIAWVAATAAVALGAKPTVIKAIPDNGEVGVDPGLTQIRVTFDQPMKRGTHSVVGGGETFPEITGTIRWSGRTTVIIPVRLEPNHEYWLSINNQQYRNFQNAFGEAAVPYPIRFTTGDEGARKPATDALDANGEAADELARVLTTAYSHRDKLGIDWGEAIAGKRDELAGARDADAFARIAGVLLARAQDKHIWLQVGSKQVPSYMSPPVPNVNPPVLAKLVPNYERLSSAVAMGRFEDGIGYLEIDTWHGADPEAIEAAFDAIGRLRDARAMIIDVRANGGGDETLAQQVAGCFIDEPVLYAKNRYVDADAPGGFGEMHQRWVRPNTSRPRYSGPVIVLSGGIVMSSNESFVMMMRAAPRATVVGGRTQGSSGNPKPHDLGNGVTVWVPSWQDFTPGGEAIEGVGVPPDVGVETAPSDFASGDPVLERALEFVRE